MKPVLLLIPGMLNDADVWRDVSAALAAMADVRMAEPTQASVPAMAEAAWSRLADVPPDAPVVLAGFSLGGYVAIQMLAHPRRRLKAAALISTSPRPETTEGLALRERTIAAIEKNFEKVVDGLVAFGTHAANTDLQTRLRAMMLGVGAATAIRQNRAIAARGDHRAALAALRMPVAVLCGAHDRITPPALSQETAALVAGAELMIVENAGHMLPMEQPAAVADVLRRLLAG
jgi:pimeloyl-ACP methyl ester carboxylesterase